MATRLWAKNEVRGMNLRDKRRGKRVEILLEALADNPTASISQACDGEKARTKGAYRIIENSAIHEQDILEGHYRATVKKIEKSKERILFISDGMDASYNNLMCTEGLGTLANSANSLGIKMHNTCALGSNGTCFGLIDQEYWTRDRNNYGKAKLRKKRPTEDKETRYWLRALEKIEERLPLDKDYTFIGDGGADVFDIFNAPRRANSHLLIHLVQNRNTTGGKLFEMLDKEQILGYVTRKLKRTPKTPEREVKLEIRIAPVEIKSPHKQKALAGATVKMYALVAREIESSIQVKNPILWRLVTTIPLQSIDDAKNLIDLYAKRWFVERFHYVLKEGSRIEKLQLETTGNLKRAIALYSIVAWRIMHITYIARSNPHASCTEILSDAEWQALWCHHNQNPYPPEEPPTAQEAIKMIAKIGGFLGRKGDGEPGAKVLWRGMAALEYITDTYLIFRGKDVGNA